MRTVCYCLVLLGVVLLIGCAGAQVPAAAFSGTPTSGVIPLSVAFTDQSTGGPTGWAWYFGDENYTAPWTLVNASPGWTARKYLSGVVTLNGTIVIMGGQESGVANNETWLSTNNGISWTLANASSGWPARYGHSSVALPDGSIVLMGGYDNTNSMNDVWRSTDNGTTWALVNASPGWSVRYFSSSVALPDGSIVLMGGKNQFGQAYQEVWRSADDGSTWAQVTQNAQWAARSAFSSVVMPDGSIVLIGGSDNVLGYDNETWRSMDQGATWTEVNASSGWTPRMDHGSVVMPDGSIVLMGGYNGAIGNLNDVWQSTNNGLTWTEVNASAGWTPRGGYPSMAMPNGSIVMMGGYDNSGMLNDTWQFVPKGSSAQNPSHTYNMPGSYQVTLQAYNINGFNSTRKAGYINAVLPVVADFWGTPTFGPAPLDVAFMDNSTGQPTSWNWTFGDGNFSYLQNPVHRYLTNGNFTVALNATNSVGSNTMTKTKYIQVTPALAPPVIKSITPTTGVRNSTVSFTILGNNFQAGHTTAEFRNQSSGLITASLSFINATNLTGTIAIPANASTGLWNIRVVTTTNGEAILMNAFTVKNASPPTIAAITPPSPWYRNASVKFLITGTNFQPGKTTVNFTYPSNGTELNLTLGMKIQIINTTAINGTVVIPYNASAVAMNVSVTTVDGGRVWKASAFTIAPFPAPTIASVAPSTPWYRNASVKFLITGTNFQPGHTIVNFTYPSNGTQLNLTQGMKIQIINTTAINGTVVIPYNASAVALNVSVRTLDGGRVWKASAFTIAPFPAPTIVSVAPTTPWYRNASVFFLITGTNFQPGQTTVNFTYPSNGTQLNLTGMKIQTVTATTINGTVVVPYNASAVTMNVSVRTLDGGKVWKPAAFTVAQFPAPTIGAITPASGFRNTTVAFTITGTNFQPGQTTVNLSYPANSEISTTLYAVSSTQIIGGMRIPGNATNGAWKLNVTTLDGGLTTRLSAFTISKLPAPTVTAFAPSAAYRGTTVSFIVNGSYFEPGGLTIVNLTKPGQTDIPTNLTSVYSTQIAGNFTIPAASSTGSWNVNVSTLDGGFVTKASALSVL
jgi:PKD repeat protein